MHLKQQDFYASHSSNSKSLKCSSYKQIHRVLPTVLSIARSCPLEYRYPILKLLKELSKMFRLNEFQVTFFAYMVRQTKWNFKEQIIHRNSYQVNEIISCKNHQGEFKSIILYLLLIIFTVKKFLNEDYQFFLEEALQISPNFTSLFQKWSKKHTKLTNKFSLKTLNKIYQDLNYKTNQYRPNFNILVDSIMQISPPYNANFNKNKESQNDQIENKQKITFLKDKQSKKHSHSLSSIYILKSQENQNTEINPVFSTERIYEMVEGVCLQNNMIEVSDFQVFGLKKLKNINYNFDYSLFGSSQNSADQNFYRNNEEYFCYQIKLGLEDGQSQQNVKIDQKMPDQSQNLMLSESRINLTDQYLTWKVQGQQYNY